MEINNWYITLNGGVYYVRQIDNRVCWFGESIDGNEVEGLPFANIFVGTRSGNEVSGKWFDIPKGKSQRSGTLIFSVSDDSTTITRISETGGFSHSNWYQEPKGVLKVSSNCHNAGFRTVYEEDYTGVWLSDDGAVFYLLQTAHELVWFAEKGNEWSHIFVGIATGDTISGNWMDVPKASRNNFGQVEFNRKDGVLGDGTWRASVPFSLKLSSENGGFSTQILSKIETLGVDLSLETLELFRTEESYGDEPYLWTVFAKIDGSTVDLFRAQNSPTIISNSGSHNNLTNRSDRNAGLMLPIVNPAIGKFSTVLQTLTSIDPQSDLAKNFTFFGFLGVAWDEDGFTDRGAEGLRHFLVSTLTEEITPKLGNLWSNPNISIYDLVATATATGQPSVWEFLRKTRISPYVNRILGAAVTYLVEGGTDDLIGYNYDVYSFNDLISDPTLSSGSVTRNISLTFYNGEVSFNGIYKLHGKLTIYYLLKLHTILAIQNRNGGVEIFYLATGNSNNIYHKMQDDDRVSWRGTTILGTSHNMARVLAVGKDAHGMLQVFYIGTNNGIYFQLQNSDGSWQPEKILGSSTNAGKTITVSQNGDGFLNAFYIGTDDCIYHNFQHGLQQDWSGEILLCPSSVKAKVLAAVTNRNGGIDVFYVGIDGLLYSISQSFAGGTWSGISLFVTPTNSMKAIEVAKNHHGGLEAIYIGVDNQVYHNKQILVNSNFHWTGESLLGPIPNSAKAIAIGKNEDERLELFYIGTDNLLYHTWQIDTSGVWSEQSLLGGSSTKVLSIAVCKNSAKCLEVFYVSSGGKIYHNWQETPNGAWVGENILE